MNAIRCVRCGAEFGCNPQGDCWCKQMPPVAPVPAGAEAGEASCLCPECLRALMGETLEE